MGAARKLQVQEENRAGRDRLNKLDAGIDELDLHYTDHYVFINKNAARVMAQYTDAVWAEELYIKLSVPITKTRMIVGTADKACMALNSRAWRARERDLDILFHDENESEEQANFAALAAHFNKIVTTGDKKQRIPHRSTTKTETLNLPPCDPQAGLPTGGINILAADAPAVTWLEARASDITLDTSERFGNEVIDLAAYMGPVTPQTHVANENKTTNIVYNKTTNIAYLTYSDPSSQSNGWLRDHLVHPVMFMTIAASALRQACTGKKVAIIFL